MLKSLASKIPSLFIVYGIVDCSSLNDLFIYFINHLRELVPFTGSDFMLMSYFSLHFGVDSTAVVVVQHVYMSEANNTSCYEKLTAAV